MPMLFRAPVPGSFTETWLLQTQPVLEGGAKIKFVFRGVARMFVDYMAEIQKVGVNKSPFFCLVRSQDLVIDV